jgi:uncharacterized protein YndB with AHSA1/START domain/uncharacterized glyoxalase superfamily protein PhnB
MPAMKSSAALDRRSMIITRVLSAPCDKAFEAWSKPEALARWFGPNGFTITTSKHDFRVGGTWRFVMHGPDGTDYQNIVRYDEIVRPDRIVYRHGDPASDGSGDFQTTITFEPKGARTLITLRAVFTSAAIRDKEANAIEGGTQTLARLDSYLSEAASPKTKAMATKTKSAKSSVEPFVISRTFNAPRAAVVKAWTDEKELMKWWGPKGGKMLSAKMDLRPGGIFHYSMQSIDFKMWGKWIIKEVDLPNKLVWLNCFSDPRGATTSFAMMPEFPRELLTTVTFTEKDGKTAVKIVSDPTACSESEQRAFDSIRESMNEGWGGSLDVLGEVLAKPETIPQMVIPHLTVKDTVKAIAFYEKVFGAKEVSRMPAQDGKRILHCVMSYNGTSFFLSDEFPEHGGPSAPTPANRSPVAIALNLASPAALDKTYAAAIKAGAKEGLAPHDSFWGARFAMLTDPSGHRWMLNADNKK